MANCLRDIFHLFHAMRATTLGCLHLMEVNRFPDEARTWFELGAICVAERLNYAELAWTQKKYKVGFALAEGCALGLLAKQREVSLDRQAIVSSGRQPVAVPATR